MEKFQVTVRVGILKIYEICRYDHSVFFCWYLIIIEFIILNVQLFNKNYQLAIVLNRFMHIKKFLFKLLWPQHFCRTEFISDTLETIHLKMFQNKTQNSSVIRYRWVSVSAKFILNLLLSNQVRNIRYWRYSCCYETKQNLFFFHRQRGNCQQDLIRLNSKRKMYPFS